jgi:type I restriction enzyme, S subunit
MGQAPPGDSYNDDGRGVPLVAGAGDMTAGRVVPTKYTTAPTKLSRPDDVIIGIRASIGMRAQSSEEVCLGRGVAALRPGPEVDRGYLWHWIEASASRLAAKGRGATFLQVGRQDIAEMEIPVPPVEEQRRIAGILDLTDALRAKRRASIAQLDELIQSVFLDSYTRPLSGAEMTTLNELAEDTRGSFVNGPFGSGLLTSELRRDGVPVIYIRDIRAGEYQRVSTACVQPQKARQLWVCKVLPGDVLVAKVGDPPGAAAVYPEGEAEAIVTQDVIRIRVARDRAVPSFLAAYLNSSIGKRKVAGITVQATRARFALGEFKKITFELPSLAAQLAFAERITAIESVRSKVRASLPQLDSLLASLRGRAFSGDL